MSLCFSSISVLLMVTLSLGCAGTIAIDEAAGSAGGMGGVGATGGGPANPCVDTANDPHNCGLCGHDCLGGACIEGRCQPVVLASGEAFPYTIISDGSTVFWANWSQGNGPADNVPTILRAVGVDGVGLRTVGTAPYFPSALHGDETSLYWYRSTINSQPAKGAVMKMAKSGGAPTILFDHTTDSQLGIALGPSEVYWWPGKSASNPTPTAWKVTKDGAAAQPIGDTGTFSSAGQIEVDENAVYALTGVSHGIVRLELAGGPPTILTDIETRWFLALDDAHVFFMSPEGLQRVGKDGSDLTLLLADSQIGQTLLDATHLYYANNDGLRRVRKDGGGDELLVAEPLGPIPGPNAWGVNSLAQDDRAVYFVLYDAKPGSGSIVKIAK